MIKIDNQSIGYNTIVVITNPITGEAQEFKALFDTGATMSGLTPNAVKKLNLKSTGIYNVVQYIDNQSHALAYEFKFKIKGIEKELIVEGGITPNNYPDCDVIIGLDIINQGELSIKNYTLKFDLTI